MRNTMLISTAVHFALYFSLRPSLGNTALWLAFVSYLFARGVCQLLLSKRLERIYEKAKPNA
jgi:MATE family multidrug resistance protein